MFFAQAGGRAMLCTYLALPCGFRSVCRGCGLPVPIDGYGMEVFMLCARLHVHVGLVWLSRFITGSGEGKGERNGMGTVT